jgi:hypothetical protein
MRIQVCRWTRICGKIRTISTMTLSDAPLLKGGGQSRVPRGAAGVLRFGSDVSDTAVGVLTWPLQRAHTQEKYVGI